MKKHFLLSLLAVCSAIFATSCQHEAQTKDYTLWYNQPASIWEEALPIGN